MLLLTATKLLGDSNKNLEHLFGGWKTYQAYYFFMFTPSVGVEHFFGGSRWKACFCAYPQCRSSAYVGGVYVILILRA